MIVGMFSIKAQRPLCFVKGAKYYLFGHKELFYP